MDDESADIELLEQHLNRSSQLSTRMTSVLQKFDRRLQTLEKSILPLHKSTQSLTRLVDNIDKTLQSLDKIASTKPQAIDVDEALILRGPRDNDLGMYADAVKTLNAGLAFSEADRSTQQTARLAETGAKKIAQMFTTLVAESASSALLNPIIYLGVSPSDIPLLTRDQEDSLIPVVSSLRSLPTPTTHPSHPASSGNLKILNEAQDGYADMRGGWAKRCLEFRARELVRQAEDAANGIQISFQFAQWTEGLLLLAEAEYELLRRYAPLQTPATIANTYGALISPILPLFTSTIAAFQALAKRSVRRYLYLAFSTYGSLSALQGRWDSVLRQPANRKQNELADGLHSLRAVCLRIFPEIIADIKIAGSIPVGNAAKPVEIGTGIASITQSTVEFLEQLTQVQEAAMASLRVLGDGNWNMGDASGNMRKVGDVSEVDDHGILEHFTYDVISNLLTTITTLTKTQKRLPLGSIFLINNVSYLRLRLLSSPETPVDDMLSAKSQAMINGTFRSAKATYIESNLTTLIQTLSDDRTQSGLKNDSKGAREKSLRFFDCLDEWVERHRFAKVLKEDDEAREKLSDDVVKLVVPILQTFVTKHKSDLQKNYAKYVKHSPDEVERLIRSCL